MGRLHRLVDSARHEDVRKLLDDGVDINEMSENLTPLELAVHNNDVAMVEILINAGADVNHGHPKSGVRPLHGSINKDPRIMELLLAAGADVEGCRITDTPLCTAAMFGNRQAYDRLLAAGANPLATRRGKLASEWFASSERADAWMKSRIATDLQAPKVDQFAGHIRKMMEEYPTVEEFAAHRGRAIFFYGLDQGAFSDPEVERWAKRLGEIIRSPELLEQLEEQILEGQKLEAVRRERKRTQRWLSRDRAKRARIQETNMDLGADSIRGGDI